MFACCCPSGKAWGFTGKPLWVLGEAVKGHDSPRGRGSGSPHLSSHLQLFLVKVAQPLQGGHLVEAIQECFGLLFHTPRETPVSQQPETKTDHRWSPRPTPLEQLRVCREVATVGSREAAESRPGRAGHLGNFGPSTRPLKPHSNLQTLESSKSPPPAPPIAAD